MDGCRDAEIAERSSVKSPRHGAAGGDEDVGRNPRRRSYKDNVYLFTRKTDPLIAFRQGHFENVLPDDIPWLGGAGWECPLVSLQ